MKKVKKVKKSKKSKKIQIPLARKWKKYLSLGGSLLFSAGTGLCACRNHWDSLTLGEKSTGSEKSKKSTSMSLREPDELISYKGQDSLSILGRSKVKSAIDSASAINPGIRFLPYSKKLTKSNAISVISKYDIKNIRFIFKPNYVHFHLPLFGHNSRSSPKETSWKQNSKIWESRFLNFLVGPIKSSV